MNKKIIIIVSLLAILAVTLTLVYMITKTAASSTVLYVDPKTIRGTVGQDFVININISNVIDLYAWGFKLRWDAAILDVVNVTEGTFLRNGGSTFFVPKIDNTAGYITVDCTLLGNIPGVGGNGTVATIQFHVKESGSCDLDLCDTMLIDSLEQPIAHSVSDGHFRTEQPTWVYITVIIILTIIAAVAIIAIYRKKSKSQSRKTL